MALDQAVVLLQTYGYFVLIPLAIIEGPIVTIIAGFLVAAGVFNPFISYAIVVAGDLAGDTLWYSMGRFGGGPITRFLERFFGITQEKIEKAKHMLERHRLKTTAMFKITQGVGFAGLIAAGLVRMPYPLFIAACLPVTLIQGALFLIVGVMFGSAYESIGSYFTYAAETALAVACIALLVWYFRSRQKQ